MNKATQEMKDDSCCMACGMDLTKPGGMCAACVLGAAVESLTANDHPALGPIAVRGRCPSIESLDEQFEDFQFGELLGRGGSAWTFLATQKSLSRKVAVKLISRADSRRNELDRFQREAGNLARLNHPNIVTVHDFGATEQFLYIVMEYVPNWTLRSLMSNGPLEQDQVSRIGTQICKALQHAHESGLVHRDIKPENILIVNSLPDVEIRIADFGISQFRPGNESHENLTRTGLVIGTPFYMAPEQQVPGKVIDRRADIYATGVVLYELLTGQLPQGRFASPSELGQCGHVMDAAVMQSLSNDPSNRFGSAEEFQNQLQSVSTRGSGLSKNPIFLAAMSLAAMALIALLIVSQLPKGKAVTQVDGLPVRSPKAPAAETTVEVSSATSNLDEDVNPFLAAEVKATSATSDPEDPPNPFLEAEERADSRADQPVESSDAEEVSEDKDVASEIPENYQRLLDDISRADYTRVKSALTTLKSVPPDPAIEEVTARVYQLTMDNNPFISGEAHKTLAVMDIKASIKAFENALRGTHSSKSRAFKILTELNDERFLPLLADSLKSTGSRFALNAIVAQGPKAEPVLIDYLRQAKGWMNMKPAIMALGEIGSEESYELLEKLMSSDEPFVGSTAAAALDTIKTRINPPVREDE